MAKRFEVKIGRLRLYVSLYRFAWRTFTGVSFGIDWSHL